MTQLRKIEDVHGQVWSVPPALCIVLPIADAMAECLVVVASGEIPSIRVANRARVEYILTMRDPREHCDPLPEWMDGADPGAREGYELEEFASRTDFRREGEYWVDSDGWDAQQAIAQAFYDDHVIGWE